MNKPNIPPMLPSQEGISSAVAPKMVVRQPSQVSQAALHPPVAPTRPAQHAGIVTAYVDPYLFETGYYASRAEYEELSRTAPARLQLRADIENAPPKRKK